MSARQHVVVSAPERTAALLVALLVTSCREPLPDDLAIIDSPRLLAVRADPAESPPDQPVTFTALYLDATAEPNAAPLDWAFCVDRKPLSELGPVAPSCLEATGPGIVPIGAGAVPASAIGAVPKDACRLFGPDPPEPKPNEPAGRPVDPDRTGGYYQPLRLLAGDVAEPVLGQARIACGLATATPEVARDFTERYVANQNPEVASFVDDGAVVARAGEDVDLTVTWASCVDDVVACTGAESYLRFDPATGGLEVDRESIRVSWFATAGRYAIDRTGRARDDRANGSTNTWTAPETPGEVVLVVVLRDDRGGVGWRRVRATVE